MSTEAKVTSNGRLYHKHGETDWHWLTDTHKRAGNLHEKEDADNPTWIGKVEEADLYAELIGSGKPQIIGRNSSKEKVVDGVNGEGTREDSGSDKEAASTKYVLQRV